MGKGLTNVRCLRRFTANRSQSMRESRARSTVSRKLLQCDVIWKPIRSAPSNPSSNSLCQGQMPKASGLGQGMCQKIATRQYGAFSLIKRGNNAKWPQSFVRKAIIVAFDFFLTEPDTAQRVVRVVGRYAQAIIRIHRFPVCVAAAVRHPSAITGAQNRLKSGHEPACGDNRNNFLAATHVLIRLAVGDGDQ